MSAPHFSKKTLLLSLITEAQVRRAARAWERSVLRIWRKRIYTFNAKSGIRTNRNYKQWCLIVGRLDAHGYEFTTYFEWRLTVAKEKVPWPNQIATPYWLGRYELVRAKWRARSDRHVVEIQDGAATLAFLLEAAEGCRVEAAGEAILLLWSALPPAWLALSKAFWEHVAAGRIATDVAAQHFRRARELHDLLKKDRVLAAELACVFQKETGAVVYR